MLSFQTAKRIVKSDQHIFGKQCIRHGDYVLAVSNEDKTEAAIGSVA